MNNRFFFILFVFISLTFDVFCFIDLEDRVQKFVLETHQIHIKEYPDAFNPSIVDQGNGHFLMCFRIRNPDTGMTNEIGFVNLDSSFKPHGPTYLLEYRTSSPFCHSKVQDPRLVYVKNKLFIVFNNTGEVKNPEIRRMFIAQLHFDGSTYYVEEIQSILSFEGEQDKRHEKNWPPFDYNGHLFLAYSLYPHRILAPISGTHVCETIASTNSQIQWDWGELRGGTPALLDNGQYLAFFHTCKSVKTVHSNGNQRDHYFMGAYTFEASPPFQITHVSPEPIVGKNFYHGPKHKTWKPLHVVFPGGFVMDSDFIWVVYGRQDHELWVVKLDKSGLLSSLNELKKNEGK